MREYLIRLIYCEMLGVECTWGYIHAVKFTQSSSIADKRTGKRERKRDNQLLWNVSNKLCLFNRILTAHYPSTACISLKVQ